MRLEAGEQVAIDLTSEDFDTISLLFARITQGGKYIVRVRAFGETGSGSFKLKVTRLRPVKN